MKRVRGRLRLQVSLTILPALLLGCRDASRSPADVSDSRARPGPVKVIAAGDQPGTIRLEGGVVVGLEGLDVPPGQQLAVKRRLDRLAGLSGLRLASLEADPDVEARSLAMLERSEGASVNEELLEDGLAFFRTRGDESPAQARLLAASLAAKRAGRGVWKGVVRVDGRPPRQRGATVGLYYKRNDVPYDDRVDRVVALGADWVQFLITVFVDRVDSSAIEFDPLRTPSDARVRATIRYARNKGLRVALLPIVLIRHEEDEDWRGTLRPKEPGAFWRSYEAFLRRYLDIAREEGVELFYIGSELCSLEKHRDVWPRLIANARGRYGAWLSYSVNWDHYDVPDFWHLLDQVGMTAYFELTENKKAGLEEITKGWERIRKELEAASKRLGRGVVLTELGYASQDGTNTAPWNYYLSSDLDLEEQANCFRAFVATLGPWRRLEGVYVYGFFEEGGPKDTTYAIWKKPAFDVMKRFFASWK